MNLGLVTSFIVAGILMLGIVMVNINVQNSTAELTLAQITRNHVSNITDMINDDFSNMGYQVNKSTSEIDSLENMVLTYARNNEISFYRNLSDDPTKPPHLITWKIDNDDIPNTKNPDHHTLYRLVEDLETGAIDSTAIRTGVTNFFLRYYNTVGADTQNDVTPPGQLKNQLSNIRQVHVTLELQSAEPIYNRASGQGRYIRSVWDKRFTPINLNLE